MDRVPHPFLTHSLDLKALAHLDPRSHMSRYYSSSERVSDLPKVTEPAWGPAPFSSILSSFLSTDLMLNFVSESNLDSSCCCPVSRVDRKQVSVTFPHARRTHRGCRSRLPPGLPSPGGSPLAPQPHQQAGRTRAGPQQNTWLWGPSTPQLHPVSPDGCRIRPPRLGWWSRAGWRER